MVAERTNKKNSISILLREKAKNLYIYQCLAAREVATQCGLTPEQVVNMVKRYGWSAGRKAMVRNISSTTQEKIDEKVDEISEALASESAEIAMASLVNARKELTSPAKDAPKNFQAWTAGARNLVSIRQALRNGSADTLNDSSAGANTRNVAVFFMSGDTKKAEKRVQSAVDASGV